MTIQEYFTYMNKLLGYSVLSLKKNEEAVEYLLKRGVTEYDIKAFKIGYIPNKISSVEYKRIIEQICGINYEKIAHSISFPIVQAKKQPIGFIFRRLETNEEESKYIVMPTNKFFHRGKYLFGELQAQQKIKKYQEAGKEKALWIVEGPFDAIFINRFAPVVATMGASVTKQQINKILSMNHKYVVAFDRDKTGLVANLTLFARLGNSWDIVKIALPRAGCKDFGECLQILAQQQEENVFNPSFDPSLVEIYENIFQYVQIYFKTIYHQSLTFPEALFYGHYLARKYQIPKTMQSRVEL